MKPGKQKLSFDLGDEESITAIEEARSLEILPRRMVVLLPLPSFGSANSMLDITSDLLFASFGAELLAAHSDSASSEFAPDRGSIDQRIRLCLKGPRPEILPALEVCYHFFNLGDEGIPGFETKYPEIWDRFDEFEDGIESFPIQVPELADLYLVNLIGSYDEMESESPEHFAKEIARHPERKLSFHRSAYSSRLGGPCFASRESWLIPASLNLDKFFRTTGQRYRLPDFESGKIVVVQNSAFAITASQIVHFPLDRFVKSRIAASLAADRDEEMSRFDWNDGVFTGSGFRDHISSLVPESARGTPSQNAGCLVHASGDLICADDRTNIHVLYDTRPLNVHEATTLLDALTALAEEVAPFAGTSKPVTCDWARLDDEQFESLCYDIIASLPRFDSATLRKMGKSRSRDGGRDLVVNDLPPPGGTPRKWIFQCKLVTDGSSLSGRKLQDVGDMLEQYGAQGFGVMTSAPIDATLYDKLEAVCKRRGIEERHFSVLELERALGRLPHLRLRYFSA